MCNNVNQNDTLVLLNDVETSTLKVDIDALNTKLFSNISIIENTYLDQNKFLRGCGYLEDSVTNPVDSAGLMLSLVLNNFVNNVVFKDKGPLTRLFYPKNGN